MTDELYATKNISGPDRFGHLGAEMFRACRLVVDTGIHQLGWSRERAVTFLMDHNNYPEDMIRYLSFISS